MRSFYEILGVSRDATYEEILVAYRRRVLETHPDRGGILIEFLNVRKGFEILSDEKKRTEYDHWLYQKEAKDQAFKEQAQESNQAAVETRTRLMPYIEVLLECHCNSQKLKENVLYVCSKVDDVFLHLDIRVNKSIQAAIVINRCVAIIRKARVFRWEDVLDSLVSSCDTIIHKTESSYKQEEPKKKKGTNKFFVLLGCITIVVGFLSIMLISRDFSKSVDSETGSSQGELTIADNELKDESVKSKRQILYEKLTRDGYDLGDYNSFSSKIDNKTIRRNFYDVISRHYDLGSYEEFSCKLDEGRTIVEDSKRWLYDQLKSNGRISVSYAAFEKNLSNETDRKWYYTKAIDLGLEMGTYEEYCRGIGFPVGDKSATNPHRQDNSNSRKADIRSVYDGNTYSEIHLETGYSPYNDYFGRGRFDNESLSKLTILNYSNNDAVVLLCTQSNHVIRNIFVKQGDNYIMRNIPEGKYVVKIMYGKSWNKEKYNGTSFPKGGFMKNVSFSKTEENDLFDYTFERDYEGIRYPTYSLTLHKVQNGNLQMENISQSDFYR